jgi:erythronate-4-phosphate dehydrogenase
MKIVCDNKIPFLRGVLEPYADVVYLPGKETTADDLRDADAVITRTRTKCNSTLLEGSRVKVVATATIGFDHIDTSWCESHGIIWKNAPGCNSHSVKQYISSVLCTLAKRFGLELRKMTLGVVGVGNVGSKVADVGRALGMKVLLNDPPRQRAEGPDAFVSLDRLIAESDIISLHVPLNMEGEDATWHLFDGGRISSLRPSQILINSSRGPVVDNDALKAALKSGGLRAAVLDVWEKEPDIDRELLGLLAVATPHIAGYSADGKAAGTAASVRTVAQVLGLPLTQWAPSDVPAPQQALDFSVDASSRDELDVISEAVFHAYDVMDDDAALRAAPQSFEKLRGDYQIRREPSAFTLRLHGGSPGLCSSLRLLGFNVISS